MTRNIGGNSITLIEEYCSPSKFNTQKIIVNNTEYTIVSPNPDFSVCAKASYIAEKDSGKVYLTGNHQLMLFGVVTERSYPVYPDRHSVAEQYFNDTQASIPPVHSKNARDLNSIRDTKLLDICDIAYSNVNGSITENSDEDPESIPIAYQQCVQGDGFEGDVGSTLQWPGKVVSNVYAYANSSYATIRLTEDQPLQTLYPCYSYNAKEDLIPGNPVYASQGVSAGNIQLSSCEQLWVTSGIEMFGMCTSLESKQPTAVESYLPISFNCSTISEIWDWKFGCDTLKTFSASDMIDMNLFLGTYSPVFYEIGEAWGNFFDVRSELYFVEQAYFGALELKAHQFLNKDSRLFGVKLVLRNVEKTDLYYTLVHCNFRMTTSGGFNRYFTMSHVPMLQYFYGLADYPWKFREIISLESIVLFIFFLLFLHESHELAARLHTIYQTKKTDDSDDFIPQITSSPLSSLVNSDANSTASNSGEGERGVELQAHGRTDTVSVTRKLQEDTENREDQTSGLHTNNHLVWAETRHWSILLLDWFTLVMILTAIILRIEYIQECGFFHNQMLAAEEHDRYEEELEYLMDVFTNLEWMGKIYRLCSFLVVLLGLLQFFRYISFSPRFGTYRTRNKYVPV